MNVWQLHFEVDLYDNLVPVKEVKADEIQSFDGRSKLDAWQSMKVERIKPQKRLELSDAPGFILPVFSKQALEVLFPLIHNNVEVLPLKFDEKEFFVINVISVLDTIDYEKSIYRTFRDGSRIMAFKKYVFLQEVIKNEAIFKISDEKTRYAFVTDKFKELVEQHNLTGLE